MAFEKAPRTFDSGVSARRRREWATVAFGLFSAAAVLLWVGLGHRSTPPPAPNESVVF